MIPVRRFFIRVCMEPRLLPGVRWSTLKTVKSWPSCWTTMPGRSCVALTLLISSLNDCEFRKFLQAARSAMRCTRNDSRHARRNFAPNANKQYKGPHSQWSIGLVGFLGALGGGFGHDFFDFIGVAREAFAQEFVASFGDEDVVLDAHAEIFLGDVDAGFDGDDHAGLERFAVFAGVVDIETDVVAESVNEILAERFAVKIFAVGIDVVVGNFVDALRALLAVVHAGLDGCESGILRAENNSIDFALARREFAVRGKRASNVGGVAGELRANVEDDDVAVFDFAGELVVMEGGRVGAGADDGRVALRFRTSHGVDFDHFGGDLILVEARAHHAHGGELCIYGDLDGLREESNFAG